MMPSEALKAGSFSNEKCVPRDRKCVVPSNAQSANGYSPVHMGLISRLCTLFSRLNRPARLKDGLPRTGDIQLHHSIECSLSAPQAYQYLQKTSSRPDSIHVLGSEIARICLLQRSHPNVV